MTLVNDLRFDVADLLGRPGRRRAVSLRAPVPGLTAGLVRVPDDRPVHAELTFESVDEGAVVVRGHASVDWEADCARCLEEIADATSVEVDELFEPSPVEGETYPLLGSELDLEQLLRDNLVLEFPLAPAGPLDADGRCTTCGRRFGGGDGEPAERAPDPRWDALRSLEL